MQRNETAKSVGLSKNLRLFKSIIMTKVFIQITLIMIMSMRCNSLVRVFWVEIMKTFFIDNGYTKSYTSMSGWLLVCYKSGCMVGNILSGNVVNHFKKLPSTNIIDISLFGCIYCVRAIRLPLS